MPGQGEWITALALIGDEHTITGSVAAVDRCGDWRALERFAAHGLWDDAADKNVRPSPCLFALREPD